MQHISNLDSLVSDVGKSLSGQAQTPGDIGEGLFRDFLQKSHRVLEKDRLFRDAYTHKQGLPSSTSESISISEDPLEQVERLLGQTGISTHRVELTAAAVIRLARYLEMRGMGQEKVDQMIKMAKESDGSVRLDKLLGAIRNIAKDQPKEEKTTISDAGDGLRLKENLFRAGLGAEEVKDISEKSRGEKGETVLEKLVNALENRFQGIFSREEIEKWLGRFNVSHEPLAMDERGMDSALKGSFLRFAEAANQDQQKAVKQEIARLMIEKGIPPEKVKSFLEGMTVEMVKNLLDKEEAGFHHVKTEGKASQNPSWLSQVQINSGKEWSKGNGEEKVLNILEKNEAIIKEDGHGRWYTGEKGVTSASQKEAGLGKRMMGNQDLETMTPHSKKQLALGPSGEEKGKFDSLLKGRTPRDEQAVKRPSSLGEPGTTETTKPFSEVRSAIQPKGASPLPQPLPKIVQRMVLMAQSGEQKGVIHISPPDLGRLDLEVVVSQGRLQANLSAESLQAKEMIEANLSQLRQQLSDQGFIVDRIEVKVGLDERRFSDGKEPYFKNKRAATSRKIGVEGMEGGDIAEMGPFEWLERHEIDVHV